MINTGDVLICTSGNQFYKEGELYTVGDFVNDKYFILFTGHDDEHWYATIGEQGIYVSFDLAITESTLAAIEVLDRNIIEPIVLLR